MGKEPIVRELYDHLFEALKQFGPVQAFPVKTRIVFQAEVQFAAAMLEVAADDIELADGQARVVGAPDRLFVLEHPDVVTIGRAVAVINASAPVRSSTNSSAVPARNKGTASPRYHRRRRMVFVARFLRRGMRSGGSSSRTSRSSGRPAAGTPSRACICATLQAGSVSSPATAASPSR